MKIGVFLVVYPEVIKYLPKLVESLNNQTYKNFDIIVINDGIEYEMIYDIFKKFRLMVLQGEKVIAKNRIKGITYFIKNKYDILIFCDSDDFYAPNRIEHTVEILKSYDIYVNDFTLCAEDDSILCENYISNSIPEGIIEEEFIREKNLFGFTNTAIKVNEINNNFYIPEDLMVVDWFFYTCMLLDGKVAYFDNKTVSYYRQYPNNIIGMTKITEDLFIKQLDVKIKHYSALRSFSTYKNLLQKYKELKKIDSEQIKNIINKNKKFPLWWENINFQY